MLGFRRRWREPAAKEFYDRFMEAGQQTVPAGHGALIIHADGTGNSPRCGLRLAYLCDDWGFNFAVGRDGEIDTYGLKTNLNIPELLVAVLNSVREVN
ncbi:MAG: hypothetical protein JRN62_02840 [Nitrososphaerota archaeon]|jgi:hypothetical protein|nr:hypothetical protein [Nitrososphaerota archaeon]MDG6948931.1 hypothetical protein [Nitrososphaerota archaeon]